jgi:Flp pilus assembly protein TadG
MRFRLASSLAVACVLKRFRRDRRGSAAVEFAMIAAPFFMMMFAIVETTIVFFANQVLETATQDTARLIMTGQAQLAKMDAATFKTNFCTKLTAGNQSTLFNCSNVEVDVKSYPQFANIPALTDPITNGNYVSSTGYNPGHAGDIVVVRTFYQWPLVVTGLGYNPGNLNGNKRLLVSTAAFKNEPGPF